MADADKSKRWFTIEVDDKPIGLVLEESAQHKKAQREYFGLKGIVIRPATAGEMQKFQWIIKEHAEKVRIQKLKREARKG